jgi:ectoine hydroxylase-related dioxygenase (phytanoyl-CoA dioxygenase family)
MIASIESSPSDAEYPIPEGHYSGTYREEAADEETQTVYSYDPFRRAPSLLGIALDPFVLSLTSLYFGRKIMLHQVVASRYLPMPPRDFASWQWHHDAWGKRINVMCLLTDVTEKDQYMSYMAGSHRRIHPLDRYTNSRYTEEEVQSYGDFRNVTCTGPAGTIFVFDSNGFHRGNRSEGAHRDAIISHYSAGRYIWRLSIPRQTAAVLSAEQREFLARNPRVEYI